MTKKPKKIAIYYDRTENWIGTKTIKLFPDLSILLIRPLPFITIAIRRGTDG